MQKSRIREYTSLEDCASWLQDSDDGLTLAVSLHSSFAPMTEGVALGVLHEVSRRGTPVYLDTSNASDVQNFPVFESTFGVALALIAKPTKQETGNIRDSLATTLWRRVLDSRGVLGRGNHTGFIFREPDYWIPQCLRSGGPSFPLRDQFRSSVMAALRNQGFPREQASRSEDDVITFLYEAARNSHEHARVDKEERSVPGVRGILVDRITLAGKPEDLSKRKDLNPLLCTYAQKNWSLISHQNRLLYSMTVADLGPGIHNTLPSRPGESAWDRLNRAFHPGQTRKNRTGDIEAGLGLAKLCASAERLHALLFIRSAELLAFYDFSSSSEKVNSITLQAWPENVSINAPGTSLTLVWPELQAGGDQYTLFKS